MLVLQGLAPVAGQGLVLGQQDRASRRQHLARAQAWLMGVVPAPLRVVVKPCTGSPSSPTVKSESRVAGPGDGGGMETGRV